MDKIKRGIYILVLFSIVILTTSMISAGFFGDLLDKIKITGKAGSQDVSLNITVTTGNPPEIQRVDNFTTAIVDGPNEGSSPTYIIINFTAYDAQGFSTLVDASANVTVGLTGEENRTTFGCTAFTGYDTDYLNYSCNITMWWWDAAGTWTIYANISDDQSNTGKNYTKTFDIGLTDGIENNITSLTWSTILAGSTDQAANEIAGLNNTGNMNQWIDVNATDLVGETNSAYALGASNFSVNGTSCAGGVMTHNAYLNISDVALTKGNYTKQDGTAQEILYFCIEESNSDLINQAYSTAVYGPWVIRVQNQ